MAIAIASAGFAVNGGEPLDGFDRVHASDPFGNRIELMQPNASPVFWGSQWSGFGDADTGRFSSHVRPVQERRHLTGLAHHRVIQHEHLGSRQHSGRGWLLGQPQR